MERSGRRHQPIVDAQSGLIVHVTGLLLWAHGRGALVVVLVKSISVCDMSSWSEPLHMLDDSVGYLGSRKSGPYSLF